MDRIESGWRKLLQQWKIKLFVQLWLQERSVFYYDTCNNIFSYSVIIISTASSATLFSNSSIFIQYLVGGLTLLTTLITAVTRQMKPAEKYQEHSIHAEKFHAILRKIDTHLNKPNMNIDNETFAKSIEIEMNNLISNTLRPPAYVRWSFRRKYGNINNMLFGEEIGTLILRDTLGTKYFKHLKMKIVEKEVIGEKEVSEILHEFETMLKIKNGGELCKPTQHNIKQDIEIIPI